MPYILLLVGAILLVAGIRNTYAQLWTLVKNDFTEQNGFLTWVAAVAVIGALGYVPRLKPLSVSLLTLLLLVLVISNQGVFAKLQQFIQSGASTAGATIVPTTTSTTPGNGLATLEQIQQNLQGLSQ